MAVQSSNMLQPLDTNLQSRFSTPLNANPTPSTQTARLQGSSSPTTTNNDVGFSLFERQVFDLTNAERTKRGIAAFKLDDRLNRAAEAHSVDMATKNYFSHQGLDGSQPWDRMKAQGYNFSRAAENIAFGQPTAKDVVTAWMNSAGHRRNILDPNLKDFGVGYFKGRWTQNFGTLASQPRVASSPTPPTNTTSLPGSGSPTTGGSTPASTTPTTPSNTSVGFGDFERQVFDLTNAERTKVGLTPFSLNDSLNRAAEGHSVDMATKKYFSHQGLDGSQPWDRMKAQGYNFSRAAENIAFGQPTAKDVVTAWMNSAGHRANILNPNLKDLGIGFFDGYWTQNFGTLMGMA
jgi:uncharacterized protein YkwD